MTSALPHGFLLRSGAARDVRAVTELVVAEEEAVRGSSRWAETDTRDWFHGLEQGGELQIVDDGSRPVGVLGLRFGAVARGWLALDPNAEKELAVAFFRVRLSSRGPQVAARAEESKGGNLPVSPGCENVAVFSASPSTAHRPKDGR